MLNNSLKDEKIAILWWFLMRRSYGNSRFGWINVHSDQLTQLLGQRSYGEVVNYAVTLGIIARNNSYSVGRFPKSFKVLPRFSDKSKCVFFELKKKKSIDAVRKQQKIQIAKNDSSGLFLAESLTQIYVADTGVNMQDNAWNLETIQRINSGNHFAVRDSFSGRFHSNMTQLSGRYRKNLILNFSPVSRLDISSCQPLIAGIVAGNKHQTTTSNHLPYHMFRHFSDSWTSKMLPQDRFDGDVKLWINLCESGELYAALQDLTPSEPYQTKFGIVDFSELDTKKFKRWTLQLFFDRHNAVSRHPIWKAIQSSFPTIAATIENLKRGDHTNAARVLQSIEALIMTIQVANRHKAEGIPIATVHDEIITANPNRSRKILKEEFQRFGITPNLQST